MPACVDGQVAERRHAAATPSRQRAAEGARCPGVGADGHRDVGRVAGDQVAELVLDLHRHRRADGHAGVVLRRLLPKTRWSAAAGVTVKLLEVAPVRLPVAVSLRV